MQPAVVLGSTRATVKHESFVGRRLVIIQPLALDDSADGPPLAALDAVGSRRGDRVMITSDGSYAREVSGHENTPARWTVIGIIDDN
ncbi:ethanolamine utilization protein EutN [Roseiconus nitratireducens]|uniref:Ethanolamine utilization protein EutN n=1 Tax=Roseiconus nitratireducens TaxID=2605748 RepID=A0A5M6CYZ5_9BACT|nr:EutN/CcmL family microcompartment protein [Roseiconus nitratireducens]KAA5540448.1 ethanolamine utilization protein EutN [Roseiconus nitratireducens]